MCFLYKTLNTATTFLVRFCNLQAIISVCEFGMRFKLKAFSETEKLYTKTLKSRRRLWAFDGSARTSCTSVYHLPDVFWKGQSSVRLVLFGNNQPVYSWETILRSWEVNKPLGGTNKNLGEVNVDRKSNRNCSLIPQNNGHENFGAEGRGPVDSNCICLTFWTTSCHKSTLRATLLSACVFLTQTIVLFSKDLKTTKQQPRS